MAIQRTNDTWEYEWSGRDVTVTRYLKQRQKDVVIPDELDGKPVARLGPRLFAKRTSIERVVFPKGLIQICSKAFDGCVNLTIRPSDLPDTLTQIDDYAFRSCKLSPESEHGLFELPTSCERIGEGAFFGCTLDGGLVLHSGIKDMGVFAFSQCASLTYVRCEGLISKHCFEECPDLITVSINSTDISMYAFAKCTKLRTVALCENVRHICCRAFGETGIKEIILPESLDYLENGAFKNCSNLKCVSFEKIKGLIKLIVTTNVFSGSPVEEIILPPKTQEAIDCGKALEPTDRAFIKKLVSGGLKSYSLLMALASSLPDVG